MIDGGLSQSDSEAGVVELTIEIFDTAKEMLGFDVRNSGKGLLAREDFRRSEIQPAGQGVVDFQPDSKKWPFPPLVARNNKGEVMDKVRGVSMEQAALAQGFQNQGNIALLEIPNAAVDEFGTAARGAFGEVVGFKKGGAQAARGGIHGRAKTGRPATNDDHVPFPFVFESSEELLTIHEKSKFKLLPNFEPH
jgi:hypothetical protein